MPRNFLRNPTFRHIAALVAVPLLLSSTGYALFAQQLSVNASTTSPTYTASQNMSVSYTRTVTPSGSNWLYTIGVTIKNNGTRSLSAWRSAFSLPTGAASISCTNATCTQASSINTAVNTGTNGTVAAGGTVAYTLSFTSALQNYHFTSIDTSGTLTPIYSAVTGLTVSASAGTRTKSGKWYTWPYTFTVTNNSGQNLAGWRILAPWSTTSNQVASMPATVNYVESASQLTILSTQAIANGTNFQFTANLSSTSQTYTLTGYTVEGQF